MIDPLTGECELASTETVAAIVLAHDDGRLKPIRGRHQYVGEFGIAHTSETMIGHGQSIVVSSNENCFSKILNSTHPDLCDVHQAVQYFSNEVNAALKSALTTSLLGIARR